MEKKTMSGLISMESKDIVLEIVCHSLQNRIVILRREMGSRLTLDFVIHKASKK